MFDKKPQWQDGDWTGFQAGSCHIAIGPHDQIKGQAKEPTRIKKLGAKVIKSPYKMSGMDMDIATFSDPDGNYFQLMSPMQ